MTQVPLQEDAAAHITVLIADDHGLVRAGLRMMLESEDGIEVVGEAADGAEAYELALRLRPTIVLADVSMPPPDGIALTRLLRKALPNTKTIVVSMHEDEAIQRDAQEAGAAGYVVKRAVPLDLVQAIRGVSAGDPYFGGASRPGDMPQSQPLEEAA